MTEEELFKKAVDAASRLGRINKEQVSFISIQNSKYNKGIYRLYDFEGNELAAVTDGQMNIKSTLFSAIKQSSPINVTTSAGTKYSSNIPSNSSKVPFASIPDITEDKNVILPEISQRFFKRILPVAIFIEIGLFSIISIYQLVSVSGLTNEIKSLISSPKYSYRIDSPPDVNFGVFMEKLGAEGWEVISARRARDSSNGSDSAFSYEIISKRRLRGFALANVDRILNEPATKID